jgi:stage IV sporulation protein FB
MEPTVRDRAAAVDGRRRRQMRWSVAVGRIAGVTIRLHVSLLVLLLLVALSAGGAGTSPAVELAWIAAVFACVVAHELAHSLVARSKGIAVDEIDLMAIGGVSRMERIPEDWRDEAVIAAAGPVASLGLASLALGLAAASGQSLLPVSPWEGPLLARLGWMNMILAGFNLLPAFPLDGGRVLRALLERHRTRVEATRRAVRISRALAWAMIGAGVIFNIWLIVIGIFVMMAGRSEEAAVLVHAALKPVPARALALPCPVTLAHDLRAMDAAVVAAGSPQVAYPVCDADGRTIGVVDRAALTASAPWTPVAQLVCDASVGADATLEDAAERIMEGPVAIIEDGRVIGVVTSDAVATYLRRWEQAH